MARFTVDPGRLNFNVERKGKEYNLRLLQRAQSIFSTLLSLLPSNYTSTIQGPNFTIELKAVAVEIARIELALEDVNLDLDYTRTRSEFLYGTIGYLCFLNNRLPSLEFNDTEFRQFLINLIRIYFQGSIPKSIKDAVGLFLTSDFQILENFLLVRQGTAGLDISDQFGFQIDVATGNQFPAEIFDLQSSIRIILDIVRPAHTLFSVRFIFQDEYEPNEDTVGRITDTMRWELSNYYYEDYRRYWSGLRDRDRLGTKECHTVIREIHSAVHGVMSGVLQVAFAASGVLEPTYTAAGALVPTFAASGVLSVPSAFASAAWSQAFGASGSLLSLTASASFSQTFAASGAVEPFSPEQVSSAWLRLDDPSTVITGAGYSSVQDILNPGNPAVQGTDGNRPANATSTNGLPIMQFDGQDFLVWPLIPANNSTTTTGWACWVRPTVLGGAVKSLWVVSNETGGAASNKKLNFHISASGRLNLTVYDPAGIGYEGRNGQTGNNAVVLNTWQFITVEYDSAGATEALRTTITRNGVPLALTFADVSPSGVITTLRAVTGNGLIGTAANSVTPFFGFTGQLGPNIFHFDSKMGGATTGLLTSDARSALMSYEAPNLVTPEGFAEAGAWFKVANASDAGPGLPFTLPNEKSGNHATTSIDARKPTLSTSTNGLPILVCSSSSLQIPLHAAINGASKWWISMHMRRTGPLSTETPFTIDTSSGSSVRKFTAQRFAAKDQVYVFNSASTEARSFGPATLWPIGTWVHCTLELNLDLETSPGVPAPEASRGVWTIDGAPVTSIFSDVVGTPGSLATSTSTPTGIMQLFAYNTVGGFSWVGEIGPNIVVGSAAMAGVTQGCLTAEVRLALSNLERPT